MSRLPIMLGLIALGGCASMDILSPSADATLTAIQNAHVRECPQARVLQGARLGSDPDSRGVEIEDIALTPLANDPSRAVRLRRITIAPGGIIAWHMHDATQGMALLVSGEATEIRNTCLDPIRFRPGDVAREDAGTAHGWRNESNQPAVFLVSHVVAR